MDATMKVGDRRRFARNKIGNMKNRELSTFEIARNRKLESERLREDFVNRNDVFYFTWVNRYGLILKDILNLWIRF